MVKNIVLFNNKGGVGKTTFIFHIGYALEKLGKNILFVDLDPQCNLSSNICTDDQISAIWDKQNSIYHAVEPLIKGTGDIKEIKPYCVPGRRIRLIVGDLRLGEYEELLSEAWTQSLAGKEIGFRRISAILRTIKEISDSNKIDYVLIDIGPNLGSLNRCVLLSCDYFLVPLVPDLFSFRGLENIGITFTKWVNDWRGASNRFNENVKTLPFSIPNGKPIFAGYINQQFNIYDGKETKAWAFWTNKVPEMIEDKLIKKLKSIGREMVIDLNGDEYKLGDFKNYHSLIPLSQKHKVPIFELSNDVVIGMQRTSVKKCGNDFSELAEKIQKYIS